MCKKSLETKQSTWCQLLKTFLWFTDSYILRAAIVVFSYQTGIPWSSTPVWAKLPLIAWLNLDSSPDPFAWVSYLTSYNIKVYTHQLKKSVWVFSISTVSWVTQFLFQASVRKVSGWSPITCILVFPVSNVRHTGPDFQEIQEPKLYFMCIDAVN